MRRPLLAGNWKMNGTRESVEALLLGLKQGALNLSQLDLAVFPPYVFIPAVGETLKGSSITWGAQNLSSSEKGAFTGEVSGSMLKDFGCEYVIVGHSERRTLLGETNQTVAAKFWQALNWGLKPILCVGETEAEREAGKTLKIIEEQLAAVLSLDDNHPGLDQAIVAYEPLWAIGTGKNASPEQAQEVHAALRAQLKSHRDSLSDGVRIIYGGSVKADNAAAIFAMPDIDGALVGGASLQAESFIAIGQLCNN